MAHKHVFGKVELTREEREANQRIWEATKDEPSPEELERRLGSGKRFETQEQLDAAITRSVIVHKLAVAREKAGLTQAELAERIGTDQASISRIERGERNITLETLAKLAKVLGLRVTVEKE